MFSDGWVGVKNPKAYTGFGPICLSCRHLATLLSDICSMIGNASLEPISSPAQPITLPAPESWPIRLSIVLTRPTMRPQRPKGESCVNQNPVSRLTVSQGLRYRQVGYVSSLQMQCHMHDMVGPSLW